MHQSFRLGFITNQKIDSLKLVETKNISSSSWKMLGDEAKNDVMGKMTFADTFVSFDESNSQPIRLQPIITKERIAKSVKNFQNLPNILQLPLPILWKSWLSIHKTTYLSDTSMRVGMEMIALKIFMSFTMGASHTLEATHVDLLRA
ncbi:hypothetical protein Tco_1080818 [Tanacetum coccineum]|uniref:Uncharacterized protein n=1 Tax=Tanacetum coccineum TaxID=301880 RepID=A0ABQ5HXP7_9ASTR